MDWLQAFILGILQGLTEFLPVSSSGHLEIAKSLFGIDPESSFFFIIVVHGATVLSTIVVFRKDILSLIIGSLKFRMNEETIYTLKILLSMLPVMVVGLLYKDPIESLFNGNMVFIGSMLILTALFLLLHIL